MTHNIVTHPASSTLLPALMPSAVSVSKLSSEFFCFLAPLSSSRGKENSMPVVRRGSSEGLCAIPVPHPRWVPLPSERMAWRSAGRHSAAPCTAAAPAGPRACEGHGRAAESRAAAPGTRPALTCTLRGSEVSAALQC
uniref:Uncharacterized protein n=1 Tax=Geospiza parvula TaxID=87175 RepID=A0A8C3M2M9_GEOPR